MPPECTGRVHDFVKRPVEAVRGNVQMIEALGIKLLIPLEPDGAVRDHARRHTLVVAVGQNPAEVLCKGWLAVSDHDGVIEAASLGLVDLGEDLIKWRSRPVVKSRITEVEAVPATPIAPPSNVQADARTGSHDAPF